MAKLTFVVVTLAALLVTLQGYAQTTQLGDCKSEVARAEPMVNSMKDEKQKQEAMKELTMAKDMMAKNDEKGCMVHIVNLRKIEGPRPTDR